MELLTGKQSKISEPGLCNIRWLNITIVLSMNLSRTFELQVYVSYYGFVFCIKNKTRYMAKVDVLKTPGSLLLTFLMPRFRCHSYLILFGVGVSCRFLFSIVSYLNISCSRSITSIGDERANLPAIVYL